MCKSDFKALLVVRAHISDAFFVHACTRIVSKLTEEVLERLADPASDLWPLQPLRELSFDILKVENLSHHVLVFILAHLVAVLLSALAHALETHLSGDLIVLAVLFVHEGAGSATALLSHALLVHLSLDFAPLLVV